MIISYHLVVALLVVEKRSSSPNRPEEDEDGFFVTAGDLFPPSSITAANTDTPPTGFYNTMKHIINDNMN